MLYFSILNLLFNSLVFYFKTRLFGIKSSYYPSYFLCNPNLTVYNNCPPYSFLNKMFLYISFDNSTEFPIYDFNL